MRTRTRVGGSLTREERRERTNRERVRSRRACTREGEAFFHPHEAKRVRSFVPSAVSLVAARRKRLDASKIAKVFSRETKRTRVHLSRKVDNLSLQDDRVTVVMVCVEKKNSDCNLFSRTGIQSEHFLARRRSRATFVSLVILGFGRVRCGKT